MTVDVDAAPETGSPARAERLALRLLQLGAILIVPVASTWREFELDRFFVPKELVLHVVALLAGLLALRAIRRTASTRVDTLLLAFVAFSAVSTIFATNPWLGLRALAVSASGIVLFNVARGLREEGLARPLLTALGIASVLVAVTSLLQAYGLRMDLFSLNRSPGGTLGNRNFVGHAAAFGLPVVLLAALRARRASGFLWGAIGTAIVVAALVLTRSRAAWLGTAAVAAVFFAAILFSSALRGEGRTWRRLFAIVLVAGAAIAAALLLPNALRWRSDNPYLESVQGVVEFDEGSGRGRLIQYEHSMAMALSNPLFGVGPGNWAADYPAYAARHDPSINESEPGTTFNPWPSSDWVAFIAERGPLATLALALAFLGIGLSALRRIVNAVDADDALCATALAGTLTGAVVCGLFDAVLLLGLPAFLVWTAIGALWVPQPATVPRASSLRTMGVVAMIVIAAVGVVRSASQAVAMQMFANGQSLALASKIDPGNYRLQMRLARSGKRKQRCEHARAAHALLPNAESARAAARGCE